MFGERSNEDMWQLVGCFGDTLHFLTCGNFHIVFRSVKAWGKMQCRVHPDLPSERTGVRVGCQDTANFREDSQELFMFVLPD